MNTFLSTQNRIHFIFLFIGILLLCPMFLVAQGVPPASPSFRKAPPGEITNGFQIGIFGGVTYNLFKGEYGGSCPCDFLKSGTGFNTPFGMTVNIPLINESSLFIRFGISSSVIKFEGARYDSLHSIQALGTMLDNLTIRYNILNLEVLLRLTAQENGIRILAGPTFGFVKKKQVELIETEVDSQQSFLIEKGDVVDAVPVRYGFLLGIEYALIPVKHVFVIPSFSLDYAFNKISLQQSVRPVFFHVSINIAYQF